VLQFRHGYVEIPPQLVLQAAQHLPLVLQRLGVGNVQLKSEQADWHLRLRGKAGGLFLAGGRTGLSGSFRGAHLGDIETFQDVADLNVVEVGYPRTAFKAGAHFTGIVFEAFQGTQLRCINHCAVANHPNLRVALEDAIHHVAACNGARALYAEGVAHFRAAQESLRYDRLEQAFHGLLDFVRNFVNDVVRAHVHVFLLRQVCRFAVRPNAEGDDNRPRRRCQKHIVFRYRANARADNFQLHLVSRELRQHLAQHFHGTLDVRLDDNRQFLDLTGFQLFVELVEPDA